MKVKADPNDTCSSARDAGRTATTVLGLVLAMVLVLCSLSACGSKALDDVINEIDSARATIDSQSTAWRDQLQKLVTNLDGLESQVSADTKDVIVSATNQITDLTNQTIQLTDAKVQDLIAQAGVEFRCNADFVKANVSDSLQYVVDDLKFWEGNHKHLSSPPHHANCWVSPSTLSLYPNGAEWSVDTSTMSDKGVIHVYGYHYRPDALPSVEMVNIHGDVIRDAIIKPAYVTQYQLDLDTSAEHFADVAPGSRLVLRWPDVDDPTTITLTLHAPALLQLTNPVVTPAAPRAGVDPAVLRVTVTNIGDVRSGAFTVNWQPDPQQPTTLRKDHTPLNPGEPVTISFEGYVYLRDGLMRSTISLNNGDQTVQDDVNVAPPPHAPAPEKDLPGFPQKQTKTGNVIGGFGEDVTYGGQCEPGYVQSQTTLVLLRSQGNARASFKNDEHWASADPTDCRTVVHFSIQNHAPDPNWVEVEVDIKEKGI